MKLATINTDKYDVLSKTELKDQLKKRDTKALVKTQEVIAARALTRARPRADPVWGAPSKGGDLAFLAKARTEFAKDAAEVGLPASWLDGRPPPLPVSGAEVLDRLQAG